MHGGWTRHTATGALAVGSGIPESIVDAKGDTIVGTAADAVARKAIGVNDDVYTVDSAQADGIVWKKIGNAMVASNAAILVSKLAAGSADQFLKSVAGVPTWVGALSTWTPTVIQGGSDLLDNADFSAVYLQIGKLVVAFMYCGFDAVGTGTNVIAVLLPVTAANVQKGVGCFWYDDSGTDIKTGTVILGSTTTANLVRNGATTVMGEITVAVADSLKLLVVYEAA